MILKITAARLENEGFEIVMASNGDEVIKQAFLQPMPDLI